MSNTNQEETPPSSSTPPLQPVDDNQERGESLDVAIACENLVALRYHNPKEAIRLANEMCAKHDKESVVHFTRGQVLGYYYLDLHDNDKNKRKVLKDAVDSIKRAVQLEPLAEYSYTLANYSFQLAKVNKEGYHEVVQECERALSLDVFSDIPENDDPRYEFHKKLKADFQTLITTVKAAAERESRNRTSNVTRDLRKTELVKRIKDRESERRHEFVKKTGEYWRRLSYKEKSRILDVKVMDVERFYGSGENKNLKALGILMEAVDLYREKRHWVTWSCCLCKEDRKREDYDVWSSIEDHIDKHFDDPELGVRGISNYERVGNFDSVDINNEVFILHNVLGERMITEDSFDVPLQTNKFLWDWLSKESDVELALESWENRKNRTLIPASMISVMFDQIDKAKKVMKVTLERGEKQKQEGAEDMQKVFSDKIGDLNEKIKFYKREAVSRSIYDYREFVLPLLKSLIQANLERKAEEQARIEADSVMTELIKEEDHRNKNVPAKQKTNKKKIDSKKAKVTDQVEVSSEECENSVKEDRQKQQEESELESGKQSIHEDSESGMQQEIQASNPQNEQASLVTHTILFGSFPVTLKIPKTSKQEEVARKAVEHQPENEDEAKM